MKKMILMLIIALGALTANAQNVTVDTAFTVVTNTTLTFYINFSGNTDSTTQVGDYFGEANANFDSIKYQLLPIGSGQVFFTYSNLAPGMQYKHRIYLWNAIQGVSFKPANGAYYVSTTFTPLPPTVTINAFDCSGWKVAAGYNSNDPATLVKFTVDTNPNLNSVWAKTTVVVVGAGNVLNDEINLVGAPVFGAVHYIKAFIVNSGYTDSSALDQCLPLAVSEIAGENVGIKIFPNPMVETSEIVCDRNIEGKLILFDGIGRMVKEVMIIEGKGKIEGSDLPNGIYICRVEDKQGLLLENRKISVVK